MKTQFMSRPKLALLLILSASSLLAQSNEVQIKGSLDGKETDTVDGGTLLVNGTGGGTASHIGRFSLTWKVKVDLATGLSSGGVFQLTANGGETITGAFTGIGLPTDTPNIAKITELVSVTGGTGRFQNATGRLTMDRLVDLSTGLTSGVLKGTVIFPK